MHNRPKHCKFTQTLRSNHNNANANPPPQDPNALPQPMIQGTGCPCSLRSAPKPNANHDALRTLTGHTWPRTTKIASAYKFVFKRCHEPRRRRSAHILKLALARCPAPYRATAQPRCPLQLQPNQDKCTPHQDRSLILACIRPNASSRKPNTTVSAGMTPYA